MFEVKERYLKEVRPKLVEEFDIKNPMLIPNIEKIVVSAGVGEGARDKKLIQNVADTISLITGQRAVITPARKSVAGFKIREGMPVGVKVTLRGDRMWSFLQKLISVVLPRVRDFKGVKRDGFDGRGNFNFGLSEQLVFTEVDYDSIIRVHGMNINISTTTEDDKMAERMLELIGFPFTKGKANGSYTTNEISDDPGGLTHRWIIKSMIPLSFIYLIITSIGYIIKNIIIYKENKKIKEDVEV
jgi:large subunit ribosomal protein L5